MTTFARVEYSAAASQTAFAIPFPFLSSAHIGVSQNGTPITSFVVTSTTLVTLDTGANEDDVILITRSTPHTALVSFTTGTPITQENMETQRKQLTYLAEEAEDTFTNPPAALDIGGMVRAQMGPATTLAAITSSIQAQDSLTIPIGSIKEAFNNLSPQLLLLPGSDVMKPVAGLWEVRVEGQVRRTDVTPGASIQLDWDLVDITNTARMDLSQHFIVTGKALGSVANDQVNIGFAGSLYLDLAVTTSYKLRMGVQSGSGNIELVNCFITWKRVGA